MNDFDQRFLAIREKAANLDAQMKELLGLRELIRQAEYSLKVQQRQIFSGLTSIERSMARTVGKRPLNRSKKQGSLTQGQITR